MTRKHRLIFWLLPLALLATFALLSLLANAWLASSGGKARLENEFSSSLGYTVRLTGGYRISLFPRIAIQGSGFELQIPQGSRLLARAEHYSAAIQLLPFLDREVRIDSVALRGGFLDLGTFMASQTSAVESTPAAVSIPQLELVTIEEFSLVFTDENNIIALKKVELEGFEPGREARLDIEGSWLSDGTEAAGFALQGRLYAGPGLESAKLTLNQLHLNFGDTDVSGLSGAWQWTGSPAQISGEMDWREEARSAHAKIELDLDKTISGSLLANYAPSSQSPTADGRAIFTLTDEQIDFPEVSLQWNGQVIAGSGCYWLAAPTGLVLSLSSQALDLDAIRAQLPTADAGDTKLPFNLALDMHVENASYSGAKARNVDLKIGDGRACTDRNIPDA